MVKHFVVKASVLSRMGRILTDLQKHDDLSKKGAKNEIT